MGNRLLRWCNPTDAARLPYAARLRGLSGSALSTAACRTRLCHYDRYWYRPGVTDLEEEDPWGDGIRQKLLHGTSGASTQQADIALRRMQSEDLETVRSAYQDSDDDLDGTWWTAIDGDA